MSAEPGRRQREPAFRRDRVLERICRWLPILWLLRFPVTGRFLSTELEHAMEEELDEARQNTTGLPEAELTEEQRRAALDRLSWHGD